MNEERRTSIYIPYRFIMVLFLLFAVIRTFCHAQEDERVKKAQVYIQGGFYQDAVSLLEKVTVQEPGNTDAIYLLGLGYLGLEKKDDAEVQFRKCLNLAPEFEEPYIRLAEILCDKGEYNQAKRFLDDLLRKNPKSSNARYALGVLYYKQQKVSEAIGEFTKALLGEPHNHYACANLGYIYYNEKKYDQSLEYFLKASNIDRNNPEYLFAAGWVERKKGEKTKSYQYFNRASSLSPPTPYSIMYKALQAYDEGNIDSAQQFLDELFKIDSTFSKGLILQAEILLEKKQPEAAEKIITDLLTEDPLDTDALELKARIKSMPPR